MSDGMFGERAELYDKIYDSLNYEENAATLRDLLQSEGIDDGAELIEAACGTGSYLEPLREHYNVVGYDVSEQMVRLAREKLGGVELFVADMEEYVADKPVDVLLCLFSSIGYLDGTEALRKTCRNFYRSLKSGGVVVIEPWVTPQQYRVGEATMQTYEDEDIKLCRQVVAQREGRRAILDFHWLVASRGQDVEHFSEVHELFLFTRDDYLDALKTAGFDVRFDEDGLIGRGVFVGRK